MVYTDTDKEDFENATHCHIFEGELPKNSTKIDHPANIKDWLKIMVLPGRVPTYKEVKNKMNFYQDFPAELFQDTKTKLKEYLKNIAIYNPIRGSSYIPTPQSLVKKMALVNVQNEDLNCFLYAILASLFPAERNTEIISK